MIALLSPAKNLDLQAEKGPISSQPVFLDKADKVNLVLKSFTAKGLKELQSISDNLAQLNFVRNQEWSNEKHHQGAAAALLFKGDVYQGLESWNWSPSDWEFAQHHIRILSGLYGVLRPADQILPYRLEMGTSLAVGDAKNLYQFWSESMESYFGEVDKIVNLASNEYYSVVPKSCLKGKEVLQVQFKDWSKTKYRVISFYAKKARGMMAQYIVQNRIHSFDELKDFNLDGYVFSQDESSDNKFVFLRKQALQ